MKSLSGMTRSAPKAKKQKKPKKIPAATRRKRLKKACEAAAKEVIFWRDGDQCVFRHIDGKRCKGRVVWNHFITQHQSPWLRYNLSNIFPGCDAHNLLHDHNDPTYADWYGQTWGKALTATRQEYVAHIGVDPKEHVLQEWLDHLNELLANRPALHNRELLVDLGYYGDIIKENHGPL